MRMCTGKRSRRQLVRIQCRPPPGTRDPGSESPSFFCQTAGKDLLRRRVNTVAMRKSATHDSRDRPAIRRNWVGPGYYLGPVDGSIPSCASNGCRGRGIYLDSRQRPARRTPDCPAVIWSIDVIGSISAFQVDRAGSSPVCSSSGTHTPVLVIVLLTESFR